MWRLPHGLSKNAVPYCQGVHIMALGWESKVPELFENRLESDMEKYIVYQRLCQAGVKDIPAGTGSTEKS